MVESMMNQPARLFTALTLTASALTASGLSPPRLSHRLGSHTASALILPRPSHRLLPLTASALSYRLGAEGLVEALDEVEQGGVPPGAVAAAVGLAAAAFFVHRGLGRASPLPAALEEAELAGRR